MRLNVRRPWRRWGSTRFGRSTEGRPIVARRFGGPGAPLLLMGGIHGDEPASVDALLDLLGRFSGVSLPAPFWLLPAANPDGLAAGRKNSAADVDLNRNFRRVRSAPTTCPATSRAWPAVGA